MPKAFQSTLVSLREMLCTFGPFALLVAGAARRSPTWCSIRSRRAGWCSPPASTQGAYAEFGKRYAALLKQHGIAVELRATQGAAQNLALLRDPASGVDLAFVQGGADGETRAADDEQRNAGLVSLGSIFYEPVWLFYREESAQQRLGAPRARQPDPAGRLARRHRRARQRRAGAGAAAARRQPDRSIGAGAVAPAADAGGDAACSTARLDALVLVSAPESLMVQMLLQTPGVRLLDFAQAEAYSRRFPFMSPVVLPRGVVDLARDHAAGRRATGRADRHAGGARRPIRR